MSAKIGWRIHMDELLFAASMFSGKDDMFTVTGFTTRREAAEFVAMYFTLLGRSQNNPAVDLGRMLQDLTVKAKS